MGDALGAAAAHALNALRVPLAAFGAVAPRVHAASSSAATASSPPPPRASGCARRCRTRSRSRWKAPQWRRSAPISACRCAVLRCISDRADDAAHTDFTRFIEEVASLLAHAVVLEALRRGADEAAARL